LFYTNSFLNNLPLSDKLLCFILFIVIKYIDVPLFPDYPIINKKTQYIYIKYFLEDSNTFLKIHENILKKYEYKYLKENLIEEFFLYFIIFSNSKKIEKYIIFLSSLAAILWI